MKAERESLETIELRRIELEMGIKEEIKIKMKEEMELEMRRKV